MTNNPMHIQPKQFADIARRQYADYLDRALQHLRKMFPEFYYVSQEAALRSFIQHAITKAMSYKLQDEFTVTRFLDYCVLFGVDFDLATENAWMVRILVDPDRPELKKVADIDRIQFGGALEE